VRCISEPLSTSWIDSWGRYDSGLTKVLQAFKFRGQSFLADPLADLIAEVLWGRGGTSFDLIVPVPMGAAKERARGYNQAGLLAERLSGKVGVVSNRRLLKKTSERRTQSELRKDERVANVKGTFAANAGVSGRSILLVDDVCTTGATLSECAATLRAAGAREVAAVTVARTP